jgi:hypothetical protein
MDLTMDRLGLARDDVVEGDVERVAGHELGEGIGDRVDGIPVDGQPDVDVGRPDRRVAGDAQAGSAVHSIVAAPDVKPAPKATMQTLSTIPTRPPLTASARAIGTDAAEVLP